MVGRLSDYAVMLRSVAPVALLVLASALAGGCRTIPMPEFPPLEAAESLPGTEAAIFAGVTNAGWTFDEAEEKEADRAIRASFRHGSHEAVVDIRYNRESVMFFYITSVNLGCDEPTSPCIRIHKAYRNWVNRLRSSIAQAIANPELRVTGRPVPSRAVRIGFSLPSAGLEEAGPISVTDGAGCGLFGRRGNYDQALALLKQRAASMGATYVQLLRVIEPHPATPQCFDNRFTMAGIAYRGSATRSEESAATVATCFAVSADGFVMTAYHVVKDAATVRVRFDDGVESVAEIVRLSPGNDLALLKIPVERSSFLTLSNNNEPALGSQVFTIGYPVPELLGNAPKYSEGSISATSGPGGDSSLLQISVPVQPGNSGGPLIDRSGRVVGVVLSTASADAFLQATGTLPQNLNFAVKAGFARLIFDAPPPAAPARSLDEGIERARSAVCSVSAVR